MDKNIVMIIYREENIVDNFQLPSSISAALVHALQTITHIH